VCPYCLRAYAKKGDRDRHALACARNPAKPAAQTVICNFPGCDAAVKVTSSGASSCMAQHKLVTHNVGTFWPCPLAGMSCGQQPQVKKYNIEKHLRDVHGLSMEAVKTRMATVVPIVRV